MSSEQKIQVVIDNKLFDLTKFSKTHPGGKQILENFNNCDATDYFYSIHSVQSRKMLKNMPHTQVAKEDEIPESDYLKLLYKLEKTSLFKADYFFEAVQMLHTIAFLFLAYYYSTSYPLFAACCLGFGTLIAGWVGHQADHQRDNIMRCLNDYYSTLVAGLSTSWWSNKHNLHHLSTNEMDHDGDINLAPFIYLWAPKKEQDSWNRGIQHVYFSALYSILQIKWQYDSLLWAYSQKKHKELALLIVHWIFYLFFLPWKVWVLGTLITGTVSAWVVTASHQAEHKLEGKRDMTGEEKVVKSKYQIHDYFAHQVITTRNIDLQSWFLNYICGGMQYQIEHHIFPRIPLYKLSTVKPLVEKLCAERGIEYRQENLWDISKRNYRNIEEIAKSKV